MHIDQRETISFSRIIFFFFRHSSLLLLLFHAHNLFLFPRLEVTSKKTFLHRVFSLINRFNSSFSTLLWDNFRVQATSKSVFMRDDAFPGEIQRYTTSLLALEFLSRTEGEQWRKSVESNSTVQKNNFYYAKLCGGK